MIAILTTPEARLSDRGLPCPADRISMPLSGGRQRAVDHVEAGVRFSSACDDRPAQMRAPAGSIPGTARPSGNGGRWSRSAHCCAIRRSRNSSVRRSASCRVRPPALRRPCNARLVRPGPAAFPAKACTSISPSRSPSRLRARLVTWARPPHGGWNSGRKVIASSTGRCRTRSTVRSSNSREVGSIQWASSNTISNGRCCASASSWPSRASNNFSRLRCGLRLSSAAELVIPRARSEQCPQFAELGFGRVVAGEPGGAFELRDEGIERAVLA
jgi:hypothetical protein